MIRVWNALERCLSPSDLRECAAVLRDGGVVAVPTETVYGLAADASNPVGLAALRSIKGRSAEKTFAVQVADKAEISAVATGLPLGAMRLLDRFSPGPLTVVVTARPGLLPEVVGPGGTVGVRIPDHPVMLDILRACGIPLAVTSANQSGEPPAVTLEAALASVGDKLQGAVQAGPCRLQIASTVVDLTCEPPRILREGAIPAAEILSALSGAGAEGNRVQ